MRLEDTIEHFYRILKYFFFDFKRIRDWLQQKKYFKNIGVPGPAPTFLIGNFKEMMSAGIADYDISTFKKYGRTYGFFEGSSPVIVTKDVKFIKAVMIKDFSSFVNRRVSEIFIYIPFFHFRRLKFLDV
jgi:hypothetical protein